jgi:hypothetical protein
VRASARVFGARRWSANLLQQRRIKIMAFNNGARLCAQLVERVGA